MTLLWLQSTELWNFLSEKKFLVIRISWVTVKKYLLGQAGVAQLVEYLPVHQKIAG